MNKRIRIAVVVAVALLQEARGQVFVVLPSPAGMGPYVDLDGDGLVDSAWPSQVELPSGLADGVVVRHGLGNGLLGDEQFVECPAGGFLLAGDTMGDGLADIVLLTPATPTSPPRFVVVPNAPASGFGAPISTDSTITIAAISPGSGTWFANRETMADMDGDGLADLIVDVVEPADPVSKCKLTVARSTGDGTFVETASVPSPWIQFAVGDFDADGQLDAVTVDNDGTLLHYAGTGGGQLSTTAVPSLIVAPWFNFGSCITRADFDQDGLVDIAATGSSSTTAGGVAVIMRAMGAGTFAPSAIRQVLSPSIPSQGDLNGDGWPDLVLGVNPSFGSGQAAPGISTCLNDGSGGLLPEIVTDMDLSVPESTEYPVRDFDGDGLADVGLGFILSGRGDGTFVHREVLPVGEADPNFIAAADLNVDGALDLVGTLNVTVDPVTVRLGHGDGTFEGSVQPPIAGNADELAIADLDNDGLPDLLLDQGLDLGTVTASFGAGDGVSFSAPTAIAAVNAVDIGVADLDGNGTLDVVVTRQGQLDAWMIPGDGTGGFSTPVPVGLGGKGQGLAVADVDSDGTIDLVATLTATNHLSLVLGLGSGAFAAPQSLPQNFGANHVAVADLNEDGLADLALSNTYQNTSLLLAVAPGTFTTPTELPGPGNANDIAVADLDQDGHVDIAVSGIGVGFMRGHGDGTFASVNFYEAGGAQGLALGDFDADGFTDVAVAVQGEKSLSVLLNRSAGLPSLGFQHDAGSGFPYLSGTGTTVPGSKVSLQATSPAADAVGVLVAGLAFAPQPFQGGLLVPSPDALIPFEAGQVFTGRWPNLPTGAAVYLQAWFPTTLGEAAGSNAVVGITH